MKLTQAALSFYLAYAASVEAFAPAPPRTSFGLQQQQWSSSSLYPRVTASHTTTAFAAAAAADSEQAVTVQRLPDSAVEIQIPVPGTATQAAYDKVCTELSKKITIPGFRKGSKIPPAVLEQNMSAKGGRNALKLQAIQELLQQLVEPALKEQELDPIGQPTLTVAAQDLAAEYVPGQAITLPVRCDVWPEITWKESASSDGKAAYVGLTGTYQRKPFDQVKLDRALLDLRERYATSEPITDDSHQLEMGDSCVVNMDGYMAAEDGVTKGDPLPNAASGDKVEVVLGPGRYMEGLVEGLVGAKKGETRQVAVSFPDKLRDKTLAGKRALFDVTVLEASTRSIPDVTDEFAAIVKPGLTKDALLKELIKAIDEEDAKEFTPARNKVLSDGLASVMDVQVPDTLVTNRAREKFAMMMAEMRESGVSDDLLKEQISPENFTKYKDIVKEDIIKDFKVSMATDEIARLESITVPDYQVEEQMAAIKKDAGEAEDFDEAMVRAKVQTTMERQAVMDWLAEQSNLEVEYMDDLGEEFDEALMQKLADESLQREEASVDGVVDAVIEEPAAVVEEPAAPAVEAAADGKVETEEEKQARYAKLSVEERAFAILQDLGSVNADDE